MILTVTEIKKILFIAIPLYFLSLPFFAQMVVPLSGNITIKQYIAENQIPKKSTSQSPLVVDTLTLPFFDDFSSITVFPNPNLWEDRYAFINATYPVEPISYGVATLDAIDDKGNVYNIGEKPESCDTLTSRPIDLSEFADTQKKIYLSFFYQPQGNGEAPEAKDSLVVELYSPKDDKWRRAWSTPGMPLQPFKGKIIQIADSLFQKGFRFRFRNYVSMSVNDTKFGLGALSNFDHWHIDYVRLNSDSIQAHETVMDISILYPLKSSYIDYHSIPWDHVDSANFKYRRSFIPVTIRTPITDLPLENFTSNDSVTIDRGYYIKNVKTGNYIIQPFIDAKEQFRRDSVYLREDAFLPIISYDGSDVGIIETGAFVANTSENIKVNDTVKKIEYFQYHYAYDDGTPERGFGNPGPIGGIGSFIAVYFQIYRTDYLRAVDIYFNKTRNNFTGRQSFQVCVWQPGISQPGTLIYISGDTTPVTGKFMRIILDSAIFIYDGIYVGIRQNTNEFLNIGYDINTKNKNKIFVNNFGNWENFGNTSNEDGSLMIRPVMSRNPIALGIADKKALNPEIMKVWPSPATGFIYFKIEEDYAQISAISVYDMWGHQKIMQKDDSFRLDISDLSPGIYILKVTASEGKIYSAKFIKNR